MPEHSANQDTRPHFIPRFRIRQWILIGVLCTAVLWLATNNKPKPQVEFESISMASAKADYYLESFTLLNTKANGDADYTLTAKTLIHLPNEEESRISTPTLKIANDKGLWSLTAKTGTLPDHGQSIQLKGEVELQQQTLELSTVRLSTPELQLDRPSMQLSSSSGVHVSGLGWQLTAKRMTGLIETGQLIFRDNNHVQYTPLE